MTKLCTALVFILLAAAGCEKSSDLGRMQEEATSVIKTYAPRIDELSHRSDVLLARGRAIRNDLPGIADAGRVLGEGRSKIAELKNHLQGGPTAIAAATKAGNAEELEKIMDEMRDQLETGITAANADLDAVESWLSNADRWTIAPAAPAPAPAAQQPVTGTGAQPGTAGSTGAAADGTSPSPNGAPERPGAGSNAAPATQPK